MGGAVDGRNVTRAENVRYGIVAILLSVTFFFLIFLRDRPVWSWRLAAFGAMVGPVSYSISLSFRLLARSVVSRKKRLLANVLMMPLDFAGGALAFISVYAALRAADPGSGIRRTGARGGAIDSTAAPAAGARGRQWL